jgi:hypothetical protein
MSLRQNGVRDVPEISPAQSLCHFLFDIDDLQHVVSRQVNLQPVLRMAHKLSPRILSLAVQLTTFLLEFPAAPGVFAS